MNGYDLEYIDKLRIHELRDFAKKLGVNSPTTMKKEELIGRISSIMQGETCGIENSKKYIKNCKELDFFDLLICDSSGVLDSLLNDNSDTTSKHDNGNVGNAPKTNTLIMKKKKVYTKDTPYSADDLVGFSFSLGQSEATYSDKVDYLNVQGYVDIHPSGYGILRYDGYIPSDKDSYMTTTLVKKYNLKKGNYVEGKAKFIMEGKPKIVYEIDKIEESGKSPRFEYDEASYNGLGEEYYLDKFNMKIYRGERHYVESIPLKDAVDLGFDLVDENGCNVKLVNIKARPEEQYNSHQKMEVINIPFNKTDAEVVDTVQLVLERIKREVETGMSNVLMIYNFSDLIRMMDMVVCEGVIDFGKFRSNTVNKINNILYLAKHIEKNLSCSVICIDRKGVPSDICQLMELEFAPLFNDMHKSIARKD